MIWKDDRRKAKLMDFYTIRGLCLFLIMENDAIVMLFAANFFEIKKTIKQEVYAWN